MAEITTIARPYSEAVFELAQSQGKLAEWSDMLQFASAVIADPQMKSLIRSANVKKDQITDLVIDICGDKLDKQGQNLVKVLTQYRRLEILPEIAVQFEKLKARAENTVEAEIISAFKVSAEQQQQIIETLEKRLGRKVSITSRIDKSLIGGAIIRAGDLVIDGSAVGRLEKLRHALSH
jgi:F-type H+-transporting ATPase subunit delta